MKKEMPGAMKKAIEEKLSEMISKAMQKSIDEGLDPGSEAFKKYWALDNLKLSINKKGVKK
ncbi:hypothetical protein ES705_24137 [subsurface metagenome]